MCWGLKGDQSSALRINLRHSLPNDTFRRHYGRWNPVSVQSAPYRADSVADSIADSVADSVADSICLYCFDGDLMGGWGNCTGPCLSVCVCRLCVDLAFLGSGGGGLYFIYILFVYPRIETKASTLDQKEWGQDLH